MSLGNFYKSVGVSTFNPGISFNWDPTNGNTTTTLKWKSDDISDANRSVFETLTAAQRDAILAANDNATVPAAQGVRATPRLKWELRQYNTELSGDNDTVLAYNGFWNITGNDFLTDLGYDIDINPFEMENENLLSFADAMKLANEISPIELDDNKSGIGTNNTVNGIDINSLVIGKDYIQDANLEFQLTDSLIESLTNLKYPEDALYDGNTHGQDYIKIKQWKYQPPSKDLIQSGGQGQGSIAIGIVEGLRRKTARKQQLGLIRLPMPNQIQDSNNVSWGPDQMSNLTAAVASGILPRVNAGNIERLMDMDFSKVGEGLKNVPSELKGFFTNLTKAMRTDNGGAAAQGIIGSKLLNMAGFNVSAESILARGRGVIPNNNMELLFNAPALREFQFNWKMSPRSETEAAVVNQIIKFFKAGMAVKKQSNTGSGTGASYFLGTPNVFDVQFITTGNEEIDGIMRIKECACTGCAVNYTPEGNWAAYEDGQPVSIIMTLKFSELEPIYDIDYLENKPEQYKKDNMVDDIPATAIGY